MGEIVVYSIDVTNNGPGVAHDVVITDTIPLGLKYITSTLGGVYNPLTRTVTWNLDTLGVGEDFTPTIIAKVLACEAGQDITNTLHTYSKESSYTDSVTIHVNAVKSCKHHEPCKIKCHPCKEHREQMRIHKEREPVSEEAATGIVGTVPMQTTGVPIAAGLLGAIMVVAGLILPRKR